MSTFVNDAGCEIADECVLDPGCELLIGCLVADSSETSVTEAPYDRHRT